MCSEVRGFNHSLTLIVEFVELIDTCPGSDRCLVGLILLAVANCDVVSSGAFLIVYLTIIMACCVFQTIPEEKSMSWIILLSDM